MLPAEYGGGGVTDLVTQCLVQQELCYGDIGIGNFLTSSAFFAEPVLALGSEEQKKRWITPLTGPRPPVTAVAVTEPGVGSDAASLQTSAVRDGDRYVLNGQKTWISNAPYAGSIIVFATVDPSLRSRGITAFVVDRSTPGVTIGRPMRKMGQRGIVNAEVFLEDVRVPVENRLGEEGAGFYGLMRTFDGSRILIGAGATGLSRAALDATVAYARERTQFGKPIIEHQAVAFRLADMAARTDVSHLVTLRAARLFDAGIPCAAESAIAKLTASENTTWVTDAALQTHGGWGYSREYLPEKWLRDAKLEELEEGTSDIQRLIISRSLSMP
jgi:alkylation response protein AidB-like acyl-CoA dehydrogenase